MPLAASWFLHFHSCPDRHKFLETPPLTLGPDELSGDWGARGSHRNEEGAPRVGGRKLPVGRLRASPLGASLFLSPARL